MKTVAIIVGVTVGIIVSVTLYHIWPPFGGLNQNQNTPQTQTTLVQTAEQDDESESEDEQPLEQKLDAPKLRLGRHNDVKGDKEEIEPPQNFASSSAPSNYHEDPFVDIQLAPQDLSVHGDDNRRVYL